LLKTLSVTPSTALQLRLEAFSVFNHPQLYGAGAVDGNIESRTFGQIIAAASPRLVQLEAKFIF
jgi:hypothetical protein